MGEQRWLAGLPVTGRRTLDPAEEERLADLAREIRTEALVTYAFCLLAIVLVIGTTAVNLASGWFGLALFAVAMGVLRYVPQRRFFDPRIILRLRDDLAARCVEVCTTSDMTMEVLPASRIIWSRNGAAVMPPVVAHATLTVTAPDHAAMAARFVRPAEDGAPFYVHRRALTRDEIEELDSYAPRPLVAVLFLAIVGAAGCFATFALALAGRLTTLFPPFAFFVVAIWAGSSAFRSRRKRRIIARDLETGFVVIVRAYEEGVLGPPAEILPFSHLVWTTDGEASYWRKRLRTN